MVKSYGFENLEGPSIAEILIDFVVLELVSFIFMFLRSHFVSGGTNFGPQHTKFL